MAPIIKGLEENNFFIIRGVLKFSVNQLFIIAIKLYSRLKLPPIPKLEASYVTSKVL